MILLIRLKDLRKSKKISQYVIAKLCNVTQTTVSKWEKGERDPDTETLIILADYFNVTVDYLLSRTNTPIAENKKTPDANAPSVSDEEYSLILQYRILNPIEKADVRGYINGKVSSSPNNKDEQLPQNVG